MQSTDSNNDTANLPSDFQVIDYLKESLARGKDWFPALLESISLWTLSEEIVGDKHYRYLLDGEAFDWLLLAERLLSEVDELVKQDGKRDLLATGDISKLASDEQFRNLLGAEKYSAYLNYWYGVVVEQAIIKSVEEEETKRIKSSGIVAPYGVTQVAYQRTYGQTQEALQAQFRKDKGYSHQSYMARAEVKEFTYWLFKFRIKHGEGARVASDTRKGIQFLRRAQIK